MNSMFSYYFFHLVRLYHNYSLVHVSRDGLRFKPDGATDYPTVVTHKLIYLPLQNFGLMTSVDRSKYATTKEMNEKRGELLKAIHAYKQNTRLI